MTERTLDYPTTRVDGMSFIGNRWVFTGPVGYRVVFDGTAADGNSVWAVLRYVGAHTRAVFGGTGLSEDAAHALAKRLAAPRPRGV